MFFVKQADSPTELAAAQLLRAKVYVERGYLTADQLLGGRDVDEYDEHAVSVIASTFGGDVAGCIRAIHRRDGRPLPIETLFGVELEEPQYAMEISRAVIAPGYRGLPSHILLLGLTRMIFGHCINSGATALYAILEKGLLDHLRLIGFPFKTLAPAQNVFGGWTMPTVCPMHLVIPGLKEMDELHGTHHARFFDTPFDGFVTSESFV